MVDLLRRTVVETGHVDDLIRVVETGATVEIKNLAARIIGNICLEGIIYCHYLHWLLIIIMADSNKERMVQEGYLRKFVGILKADQQHLDMPLYSIKALSMAVAHLASVPELRY